MFKDQNPVTDTERKQVLVLGYGEMGHAMEHLLRPRHSVVIWQRRKPLDLRAAVPASHVILFCLPATAHTEVAAHIAPHLAGSNATCLTIAKGLNDRGQLPAETLTSALGREHVAVLYGPMIAEEILAGRPAFAEYVAPSDLARANITQLFRKSALRIHAANDLDGLSWSAILKNVYAIAFGMADELGLGDNVRGFLAVTAIDELTRLVHALGGAASTPYRLAGLGDLITTATSSGSHHHELGREISRGKRGLAGEGIHTLAMLRTHPRFDTQAYPLFRLIEDCVCEPQDIRARFQQLFDRNA